jgi:hypothetical protein
MAPRAAVHRKFIKKLETANTSQRKKYISEATPDQIRAICDCALNVCNGNIKLTGKKFRQLYPHKAAIRRLNQTRGVEGKRRILIQQGGFLPALAAAAVPIIASLFMS